MRVAFFDSIHLATFFRDAGISSSSTCKLSSLEVRLSIVSFASLVMGSRVVASVVSVGTSSRFAVSTILFCFCGAHVCRCRCCCYITSRSKSWGKKQREKSSIGRRRKEATVTTTMRRIRDDRLRLPPTKR